MSEDGLSVKERMALWKQKDAAGSKNDSPSNAAKIVPSKLNIPAKVDTKASGIGTVSSPDTKLNPPITTSVKSPTLSLGGLPSPIQPEVPLTIPLNSPPPPPIVDVNSSSGSTKEKIESSVINREHSDITPEKRGSIKDKIVALNAGISSNNTPPITKICIEELSTVDGDSPTAARRGSIKDKIAALVSANHSEKDNNKDNDNNNDQNSEVISPNNTVGNRKSLNIQKLGVGINISALMGIPPLKFMNVSEAEVKEDLSKSNMKCENGDSPSDNLSLTDFNSIDNSALLTRASVPTRKKPSNKPMLLSLD